jgi:hypothetical protein
LVFYKSHIPATRSDAPSLTYSLRGLLRNRRFAAAGSEAPALVDTIMSKDCPVSASLTEADKADLLQIKRDANK